MTFIYSTTDSFNLKSQRVRPQTLMGGKSVDPISEYVVVKLVNKIINNTVTFQTINNSSDAKENRSLVLS